MTAGAFVPAPRGADTIVAIATPPGRGALSIVRVSGARAFTIASGMISPWPLEPRRVTLCRIVDAAGGDRALDEALVTTFTAPDSFTGEDTVEISAHGGSYVPATIAAALVSRGARPALPGEFTRRAVLNGKLDIVQAEAIGDLIDARSGAGQRVAMRQLDGGLSRRIAKLREQLIEVEALIAYDIDFPEEDDGPVARERITAETAAALGMLDALLATVPAGEIIREGAVVVIAGAPNAGKSSLFNALLGQARAIVTEVPGTTRDAIEGFVETRQWPVRLVDTAGLRETGDVVERLGIEVSERYLRDADVVLACGDSEGSMESTLNALEGKTTATILPVRTKSDLVATGDSGNPEAIGVSSETGEGLAKLLQAIDDAVTEIAAGEGGGIPADIPVLVRNRHVSGIREAREELAAFGGAWEGGTLPGPVAAVHLRAAVTALESLIGGVSVDDVLDRVFSSFCVGK